MQPHSTLLQAHAHPAPASSMPAAFAVLVSWAQRLHARVPPAQQQRRGTRAGHACAHPAELADKRCGHHEFSCGGICGAELPCGHTCSRWACVAAAARLQLLCGPSDAVGIAGHRSICLSLLLCCSLACSVCHDDDCPPCPLISSVACRCGAEAAQLPCSQTGVFQVRRPCRLLPRVHPAFLPVWCVAT